MSTEQSDKEDEIKFTAKFIPLKPFKTNFDLIVKRQSGGVWKFPMSLEATPPDVDDFIVITSALNQPQKVGFRITNKTKNYADFTAYF